MDPQSAQSFPNYVRSSLSSLSTFSKSLLTAVVSTYLLSFFLPSLPLWLANIPLFTLQQLQLWRLFTAILVQRDILSLLIDLFILIPALASRERQLSKDAFLKEVVLMSVSLQVFHCLLMFGLSFFIDKALMIPCLGLLPLALYYISIQCLQNADQMSIFCCVPVQNKYIPILFLLLLSLFQVNPVLFVSILWAYWQAGVLRNYLGQCVQAVCCPSFSNWFNRGSSTSQSSLPVSQPAPSTARRPAPTSGPTQSFQGRGVVIGQSNQPAQPIITDQSEDNQMEERYLIQTQEKGVLIG